MKILRVIASMEPSNGGPSQGIRNLTPLLQKEGIITEVVSLDDPSSQSEVNDSFTIYRLGPRKTFWGYSYKLRPWLLKNLTDYDAIIIHGLWLYTSYSTYSAYRKLRKKSPHRLPKIYLYPHGMLDPWFQKDTSRKFKSIRNRVYWRLIEKKVIASVDGILFTCQEELNQAQETFPGYHPKKEHNVGYGVPIPPPLQSSPKLCDEGVNYQKPYILYLSRIDPKKGVDLLIKAYSEILSEVDEESAKKFPNLVIAGPTNTPYSDTMRELSINLNTHLTNKISFPGMLDGTQKWNAFQNCDAFILPSHQENFGIAVAEALSCKKPVLITKSVNIWNEIVKENAGFAEEDTLEGVSTLLRRWLALSEHERVSMSENALDCFKKYFNAEVAALNLAQLIKHNH